MNLISKWRLDHDPGGTLTRLIDYGDELENEPELLLTRGLQIHRIPGGVPFLRPTKEDVYQWSFGLVFPTSSDADARRGMINLLIDEYATLAKKRFRLYFEGRDSGEAWDFTSGFITTARVRRLVIGEGPVCGYGLRFQLTAVDAAPI